MAYNVTSEWEDIHVKLGNYVERPKEVTADEIEKIAIEVLEKYDPLANKTVEQLKNLEEDNAEDEKVLKSYMEKRMAEMKEYAAKPKYGHVFELRRQDFVQEVNNAPKDVFVVLHLYQTFNDFSNILGKIFENLANKFPLVKFMRIVATNCIDNYRDSDVPGVIIYKNSTLFKQFIPATDFFGGKKMNWKSKYCNLLNIIKRLNGFFQVLEL